MGKAEVLVRYIGRVQERQGICSMAVGQDEFLINPYLFAPREPELFSTMSKHNAHCVDTTPCM